MDAAAQSSSRGNQIVVSASTRRTASPLKACVRIWNVSRSEISLVSTRVSMRRLHRPPSRSGSLAALPPSTGCSPTVPARRRCRFRSARSCQIETIPFTTIKLVVANGRNIAIESSWPADVRFRRREHQPAQREHNDQGGHALYGRRARHSRRCIGAGLLIRLEDSDQKLRCTRAVATQAPCEPSGVPLGATIGVPPTWVRD